MRLAARALAGGVLGALATRPMNVAFGAGQRLGSIDTLPPLKVVKAVSPQLKKRRRAEVAAVSHLLIGATAGSAYVVVTPRVARGPGTGILAGLVVWLIGYEIVMPPAAEMPVAHRDNRPRAITILLAHVVFGASLGLMTKLLLRR
ncbi:MAG TPA: DUF6789 family protein [Galbitalea sp.]|jgi:uncharacterized membrane protein YagU involved in acid resistance